eukprot:5229334-Pyramimonas_sp.AAC.1
MSWIPPRGDVQLRVGVRNKFRGTLERSGMFGERRGRIMRTSEVLRGTRKPQVRAQSESAILL